MTKELQAMEERMVPIKLIGTANAMLRQKVGWKAPVFSIVFDFELVV
jgi:hypothetical protein